MTDELPQEDLDTQLLAEMRFDFLEESEEHLTTIDQTLVLLEQNPENPEYLEEIFRRIHTVKGTSSFTGLNEINQIAHRMEDILSLIRLGKSNFSQALFNLLFDGLSWLKKLRQSAIDKKPSPNIDSFVQRLKNSFEALREKKTLPEKSTLEVASKPGDKMIETLRVRTDKLDTIMNLIGEFIVTKNKLNQYTRSMENKTLVEITGDIQRVALALHREVVETRLVPINSLFNLFYGTVRNLAANNGKQVSIAVKGGETLIDKRLKDLLHDPFIHLLRNAVDHGIESPEERKKAGKNPEGKIEITANRTGSSIEIQVSDDGRGIDLEKVTQKALDMGIIDQKKLMELSKNDKTNLIFRHGFSTSGEITETSGRGVGMDVVKKNICDLQGVITVDSQKGQGSCFTIQLPLSMFITRVLILKANETCLAIPFELIVEISHLPKEQIDRIFSQKGKKIFHSKNGEIPITSLPEILKNSPLDPILFSEIKTVDKDLAMIEDLTGYSRMLPREDLSPVIIIKFANRLAALLVGELVGADDLIMKPISNFVGPTPGIAGSALLPDGTMVLFIDIRTLFEHV